VAVKSKKNSKSKAAAKKRPHPVKPAKKAAALPRRRRTSAPQAAARPAPKPRPVLRKQPATRPRRTRAKQQVKKPVVTAVRRPVAVPRQEVGPRFGAGFSIAAKPAMGPKYFFSTEIPDKYHETYLRALPRDPVWLFAYWELSGETVELLRRHVGEEVFNKSKWVLRVLDVTDIVYNGSNGWRQIDIALAPYANTWYVKVWEPDRSYMLQVGIVTPDNRFFSAVNSNAAQMPRNTVSSVLDEEWTTASTDELIRLSGFPTGKMLGASQNSSEFSTAQAAGGLASGSGSGSMS